MSRGTVTPFIAALLVGVSSCAEAETQRTGAGYTLLDDSATQLRADFNRAKGSVRLLFVVDPVCPGCLHGLAALDEDLLSR
jgi:hypothetical protein